jgi:hypothetical protein
MKPKKLLELARERIFSLGLRDLACLVSRKNMLYGLGKILYVTNNAFCVFGPDATITRNKERWVSGFGYGLVVKWFENIAFPEMRPNGCGMVLAKLDELPSKGELVKRVIELDKEGLELNGFHIKPDFGKGNHFFEVYKLLEASPEMEMSSPYYAVLHCSSPERKEEIYAKVNEGEWVKTPLGKISVLVDTDAKEYFNLWKEYNTFCKNRRKALIKEVLGECEIIADKTHQGLCAINEIRLGCYDTMDSSGGNLFPVALRWDLPLYIMKGSPNLSREVIDRIGFTQRAERLGLLEELQNINILPHGGGYELSVPYAKVEVRGLEKNRYFTLKEPKIFMYGEITFTNPRELPFNYRGRDIIEKTMEYELGMPIAKLQPIETIKV